MKLKLAEKLLKAFEDGKIIMAYVHEDMQPQRWDRIVDISKNYNDDENNGF